MDPRAAAAIAALTSVDLGHAITCFQSGVRQEDVPLTHVAAEFPSSPASLTALTAFLARFDAAVGPWFHLHGYVGLARLLAVSTAMSTRRSLLAHAAFTGNLPRLQFLFHALGPLVEPSTVLLDLAATHGHVHVLTYLHHQPGQTASTAAMNGAAAHGHLNVVQFLHAHRTEGCTTDAMDRAAESGHLAVLEWLDNVRDARCTVRALDAAATHGHVEVVRYLVEDVGILCSANALLAAAAAGHDAVVRLVWSRLLDKDVARANAMRLADRAGQGHAVQMLAATCV
ncbi:Aste57867_18135 [Aphanomyces stellatus]|uniref:Aste57867_18135 protein n=1 Tax=Aphanomyces stellatus TaxID=120398 RepID=A0A485LCZ7_9STRA|nr:hypothetical protein As57867_018073 [Aphanomyces stellatus]VFT94873.1 Aste57867_18135 [Aphanomyces stellatus]